MTRKLHELLVYLRNFHDKYQKWVSENPLVVSEVETSVKLASYFLAGKLNSSPAVSELVYSIQNLMVFYNDRIIEKHQKPNAESLPKLRTFLTTLEYCEVFLELAARRFFGEKGKWTFIVIIQLIKSITRFVLVWCCKEQIVQSPPIKALNRSEKPNLDDIANHSFSFTLKRSGRTVRKIEGAPPINLRNWRSGVTGSNNEALPAANRSLERAEMFYIVKPLVHLAVMGRFGERSWTSWSASLLIDLASLQIYQSNRNRLSPQQKEEHSKRCFALLMYLMRSPFYDRFSDDKIRAFMAAIANSVPFSSTICHHIVSYIPYWQSTYFYMWSR